MERGLSLELFRGASSVLNRTYRAFTQMFRSTSIGYEKSLKISSIPWSFRRNIFRHDIELVGNRVLHGSTLFAQQRAAETSVQTRKDRDVSSMKKNSFRAVRSRTKRKRFTGSSERK